MALFNPPNELNGIPLSERSRWLLFAPVGWIANPDRFMAKWNERFWIAEIMRERSVFDDRPYVRVTF